MDDCYYVGKLHPLDSLHTSFQLSGPLFRCKKILQGRGMTIYSKQYSKVKSRNSYTVTYEDAINSLAFGAIYYFLLSKDSAMAVIKELRPL